MSKRNELAWRRQRAWKRGFYSAPLAIPFTPPPRLMPDELALSDWAETVREQVRGALFIPPPLHDGRQVAITQPRREGKTWVEQLFQRGRTCRTCGCTDTHACVDDRGPCWWAEADLCSHCADPRPNPCPPGDLKPDGHQVNEVQP